MFNRRPTLKWNVLFGASVRHAEAIGNRRCCEIGSDVPWKWLF
jgi:hypothetical protein